MIKYKIDEQQVTKLLKKAKAAQTISAIVVLTPSQKMVH